MALEQPCGVLGKVNIVFVTKLKSFNFLPFLKKASTDSKDVSAWGKGFIDKNEALGNHKAEIVCLKDFDDINPAEISKKPEKPKKSTVESTLTAEIQSTKPSPVTLDKADKHQGISQIRCHETLVGSEDTMSQREEEVLSPSIFVDLNTPASSKESILSESWEQDFCSPSSSPFTFSQTVSPCSSRSGAFSPSMVRIKCHSLAQGSSLLQLPLTSCQTLGCNSRTNSPCPLSNRAQHRLPPTNLSLLTAILRKGRLPILSPDLQRAYSPCWPISPVSLSSCSACSAASTIAPMVAKHCSAKDTYCKELNHKARPPRLLCNTSSNHEVITSTPTPQPDTSLIRSKTTLSLEDASSEQTHKVTNVSTVPSMLLFSSSTKSMSVSPKSIHPTCCDSEDKTLYLDSWNNATSQSSKNLKKLHETLDSSCQKHGQQLNPTSSIRETTEPFQAPSTLKHAQITNQCDQSSTPDLKPAHQFQDLSALANLNPGQNQPCSFLQNERKISSTKEWFLSTSPTFSNPSPKAASQTSSIYTPVNSPVCPSPGPRTLSSTPDGCKLSLFSATPSSQPSPSSSYSLCSSPIPCLRNSTPDSIDKGSKTRKPYKTKSSYKALASIPTNKLLLEQQAIDVEVYRNSLNPSDNHMAWEDPHSQMCSPAQLREQSTKLYEEIDEVLENVNQTCQTSLDKNLSGTCAASVTQMKSTTLPVPRGRETKYSYCHHRDPALAEKTLTKPGVIKRVTLRTRLGNDKAGEQSF